jgi:hypothetical protein
MGRLLQRWKGAMHKCWIETGGGCHSFVSGEYVGSGDSYVRRTSHCWSSSFGRMGTCRRPPTGRQVRARSVGHSYSGEEKPTDDDSRGRPPRPAGAATATRRAPTHAHGTVKLARRSIYFTFPVSGCDRGDFGEPYSTESQDLLWSGVELDVQRRTASCYQLDRWRFTVKSKA